MKNKANEIKTKICIPKGFFGGNCSDCIHWEEYNRASDGRAHCSGTIHQKDEAVLLMKETGNKIASLINFI